MADSGDITIFATIGRVMFYNSKIKKWEVKDGLKEDSHISLIYSSSSKCLKLFGGRCSDRSVTINIDVKSHIKTNLSSNSFVVIKDGSVHYGINFASSDEAKVFVKKMTTFKDPSNAEKLRSSTPLPPVPPQSSDSRTNSNNDVPPAPPPPGPRASLPPPPPPTPAHSSSGSSPRESSTLPPPPPPCASRGSLIVTPAPSTNNGVSDDVPPPPRAPPPPKVVESSDAGSGGGGLAAALAGAKLRKTTPPPDRDLPPKETNGGGGSNTSLSSSTGGGGGGGAMDFMSEMQKKLQRRQNIVKDATEAPPKESESISPVPGSAQPKPFERETRSPTPPPSQLSTQPKPFEPRSTSPSKFTVPKLNPTSSQASSNPISRSATVVAKTDSTQLSTNGNINKDGNIDLEKFKKEILEEFRKELNIVKDEIIKALKS